MKNLTRLLAVALFAFAAETVKAGMKPLTLADPFVLLHGGKYYAYGTWSGHGIAVAVSSDLRTWTLGGGRAAEGLALHKNDSYGEHSFWAPEVYRCNGKFIMFYTAQEHVCAAESDSPLGPFRQDEKKPLLERKGIDNSLFVDRSGRAWMYYVHFDRGNTIWMAELEKDCMRVKPGTERQLFRADSQWEYNSVVEGPFVVKIGKKYVMTYSASDFRNPDYAVGVAFADSPEGPWTKSGKNPILRRFRGLEGTGHHSLFKDRDGKWRIVFHAHWAPGKVGPRRTYIADLAVGGTSAAPELSVGGELIECQITE
jgi:beta-xylosidase